MRTIVRGYDKTSVLIESCGKQEIIDCENRILKLWFSDGTIIGIRFGRSLIYPNSWKVRVLYNDTGNYYCERCSSDPDFWNTDVFMIDAEVVDRKLIPSSSIVEE